MEKENAMNQITPDPTQIFSDWYNSVRPQVQREVSPHSFRGMYAQTQNRVLMQSLFREWMQQRQAMKLADPVTGYALDR